MSPLTLEPLPGYHAFSGPVVLVIMDGVGLGKRDESDGVFLANTPELDALLAEPLCTTLKAHGTAVGLPSDDDMGNSEVGHNALGAGRVFAQGAQLVNRAIESGDIFRGAAWQEVMARAQAGGTVHFIGLLSDGNVHSHIRHLFALLDRCAEERVRRVRVHALLDGRDVGERSALTYLDALEAELARLNAGGGRDYRIASGGGRMVTTMDRYNADWSVVERGWKAHVLGIGREFASARAKRSRPTTARIPGCTDQYLPSFVVAEDGKPVGTIQDGDAVVFFNFRGDRAIEISSAFEEREFHEFDRVRCPDVLYAGLMQYDGDAQIPARSWSSRRPSSARFREYLCARGRDVLRDLARRRNSATSPTSGTATTPATCDERFETYVEIPSDKVVFDQRPWMKSAEITDAVIGAVRAGRYKFIRLNYPNGDMVGHTGIVAAIRIAVESVDLGLQRLVPVIRAAGGVLVVTADHGNADCMFTVKNGRREAMVAHTLNPVPFVVKDLSGANRWALAPVPSPGLSHVAATLLALLGFQKPDDYDPALLELAQA